MRCSRTRARPIPRSAIHSSQGSAPGSAFPDDDEVSTYQRAIGLWPSSHCALEYHRWLVRSRLRGDGRAYSRAMAAPVTQPVLCVVGGDDPALPTGSLDRTRLRVTGPMEEHVLPGVGHFCQEEAPDVFTNFVPGVVLFIVSLTEMGVKELRFGIDDPHF